LQIFVDGKLKLQWLDEMNKKDFIYATTKAYTFCSDISQIKQRYSSLVNDWVDLVASLDGGEHHIVIKMVPLSEDFNTDVPVIAQGEFDLNINPQQIPEFKKRKMTGLPKSTLKSEEIENDILLASKAVFEDGVPIKAVITDVRGNWAYMRDENDNITGRQIIASVVYAFPVKEDCFVKTGLYYQSHQGNGIYDDAVFVKWVRGYYDYAIDCNTIKQ
jgi:hypothetical protein